MYINHRRRNYFQSGGGQIFGSQKWRVSAGRRACATQGGVEGECAPLRSRNFFENVVLVVVVIVGNNSNKDNSDVVVNIKSDGLFFSVYVTSC